MPKKMNTKYTEDKSFSLLKTFHTHHFSSFIPEAEYYLVVQETALWSRMVVLAVRRGSRIEQKES